MSKQTKNVCVIGAGASGLIAVKELLDEGHNVTCFEKHDQLGGVFYYSESKGGVYDSTVLTVSNYFMAYSCFPPKLSQKRKYWTRQEYADYLFGFVEHFDVDKHIQFNSEIVSVERMDSGKYSVEVASKNDKDQVNTYEYDCIAVCSGSFQIPRKINIRGKEKFKGEIFHSAFYKNASSFRDKRVLCIGIGETGADVAHEIAQVANRCLLSLRHYQALVERFPYGREYPNDAYTSYALYFVPAKVQNVLVSIIFKMMSVFSKDKERKEYAMWNIKAGDYFNHFFTKTEIFIKSIVENKLSVNVSGISYLEESQVVFNNGERQEIDAIMLSTGYIDQFAFLKDVEITDVRKLYKHMIHPQLGSEVVFIGWARPGVGGVPACSEMQSRYFALLCSGKTQLPEPNQLRRLITQQAKFEDEMYCRSPGVRSLVHYSTYMHDFAKIIGCSPWRKSTFANPRLLYKLWFGSQLSYIYRLYGPHSHPKQAKETIYQLSVAHNMGEKILFTLAALLAQGLTRFKLIAPNPDY